jgi:hypothetical protein
MQPTEQMDATQIQRTAQSRPDFTRATQCTPDVAALIDDAFNYHPWDALAVEHGKRVREALATAVKVIIDEVPPGPDRSAAIRKIREARMDANSAITHGGRY